MGRTINRIRTGFFEIRIGGRFRQSVQLVKSDRIKILYLKYKPRVKYCIAFLIVKRNEFCYTFLVEGEKATSFLKNRSNKNNLNV